jgi:hypothetical protein
MTTSTNDGEQSQGNEIRYISEQALRELQEARDEFRKQIGSISKESDEAKIEDIREQINQGE